MNSIWIASSVIANTTATLFLKLSTNSSSKFMSYTYLLSAVASYMLAFFSYRQSLMHFQVGFAYATITSLTSLLVIIIGVLIFRDSFGARECLGAFLICTGIIFLSSSKIN
jgi:multidrug transporter EmrE-like cation transporter